MAKPDSTAAAKPHLTRPHDDAPHILVVDDDRRIRQLLQSYLSENGFRVSSAADAAEARRLMGGLAYDLIVLDVMMPGETGLDFASALKAKSEIPILMLTALSEPEQRIAGLETGVDDYLSKPFEPRELLLRVTNILKRSAAAATGNIEEILLGDCRFNLKRGELRRDGATVRLTSRERELLLIFAAQSGKAVGREQLAQTSGTGEGGTRSVDVQINRLRRKIEPDPANPVYLQTVRGAGYVLYTD